MTVGLVVRVIIVRIAACVPGLLAVGAFILAFTAALHASLPHDPFGGDDPEPNQLPMDEQPATSIYDRRRLARL